MGNSVSCVTYYAEEEEEDLTNIEDEDYRPATLQQMQERNEEHIRQINLIMTTDTVSQIISNNLQNTNQNVRRPCVSDNVLTLEKVRQIETELELYEKISLIYLLYDDVVHALQHMIQLQCNIPLQILTEWAGTSKDNKWNVKLLEALCIIQNYDILCGVLGFDQEDLRMRFLPGNDSTSLFVDRTKKKLYHIAEKLDTATTYRFLEIVQEDFDNKKLTFKYYEVEYLEMHFLYWTTIGYISIPNNLKNLCSTFKVMERHDIVESLESFIPNSESPSLQIDLVHPSFISTIHDRFSFPNTIRRISHNEEDCYDIDPKCPGVCLIINQESFYNEPHKKWRHLLPDPEIKLEERIGTDLDRNRLRKTFRKLGFKVRIRNNLTHLAIIPTIKKVISKVPKNSSFFVCILSHGLEGKIYGVNNILVDVKEIRNTMCKYNANLKGQPKVLILQSCQGIVCQQVINENKYTQQVNNGEQDLQTDGTSLTSVIPSTADMHVFWATVPGFSAIRDKKEGSWFIQSLCKKIEEKSDKMHYQEICTLVKKDIIINKRWETEEGICVMVPLEESTLSKLLYLSTTRRASH